MSVERCIALSAPLRKEAFAEGNGVALVNYRVIVAIQYKGREGGCRYLRYHLTCDFCEPAPRGAELFALRYFMVH